MTMDDRLRQLMNLGRQHFTAGEFDQAEKYLAQVLGEEAGFADILNMLGVIYHSKERFEDAERAFEKALEINPNYTDAALNLSVTYNDRGKYKEAREIYTRAISNSYVTESERVLDPFARGKISNMHADLGDAYAGVGMYQEAVAQFERALELSPNFVDIRTKLGHVLRDMGRAEEAVEHYRKVKEEKPDYLPARLALGVTLFSLKRKEEAVQEWQECVSLAPSDRRANIYLRMVNSQAHAPAPGSALLGSDDD
jgi:tetratricopeptide (TPR) repeat protein